MPELSVIIPCYAQANFLGEALASVSSQTFTDWECIVVDDCSPDNTEDITKSLFPGDSRIKYVRTPANLGLAGARNYGIAASQGRYILPLDADDKIAPGYLAAAVAAFQAQPQAKLVYARAELFGEVTGPWELPPYNYGLLFAQNPLYCSAIFRKADWQEVNGYDETLRQGLEDWDFWLKMLDETAEVIQLPITGFFYRKRAGSMIATLASDRATYEESKLNMLLRHRHKWLRWSANHLAGDMATLQWFKQRDQQLQRNLVSKLLFRLAKRVAGVS